jgi:hypothetical protein
VRLKAGFLFERFRPTPFTVKGSFLKPRGDVQGRFETGQKTKFGQLGTSLLKRRAHAEIDGKVVQGKIPTLQGDYYDF